MKLCNIDFINCKCCNKDKDAGNEFVCFDCMNSWKRAIDVARTYIKKNNKHSAAIHLFYAMPRVSFSVAVQFVETLKQ